MPYPSSSTYPGATVYPGLTVPQEPQEPRWFLVYGSVWELTANDTRWDLDPAAPRWNTAS